MRVTITGRQGVGKSTLAQQIAKQLIKQKRRVRVVDGCVSFTHPKMKSERAARRGPWGVIIKVVQLAEPCCHYSR